VKMGVIAEEDSDVEVIREITLSILKPDKIGVSRFVGHGCGKLRRKCAPWACALVQKGCRWLVVIHDLDTHDEGRLRIGLTNAIAPAGASTTVVLIPKREIEAWLLYDGNAIAQAFNEKKQPRLPGDPEALSDPKNFLGDLVKKKYRKEYLNTVHNARIAKYIAPSRLRRCRSFMPHFGFTNTLKQGLRGGRV
jgi:hypothetical protein